MKTEGVNIMSVVTKTNIQTGETKEISLLDSNNGALKELIEREFADVMKNILDPNTDPKAKRSINIKFTFTPSVDRSFMATTLAVTSKIAPVCPVDFTLLIGGNETNPQVMETTSEVEGQVNFEGEEVAENKVIKFTKMA